MKTPYLSTFSDLDDERFYNSDEDDFIPFEIDNNEDIFDSDAEFEEDDEEFVVN